MKALLLVLLLAVAGFVAYRFYLQDYLHDHPVSLSWLHSLSSAKSAVAPGTAPTAKKDCKDLDARLQSERDHIPINLRDARQLPTTALDTRSRISPYLGLHEEYMTLSQACDIIIEADQNFLEHQQKCGFAPAAQGASVQERARAASAASARSTVPRNQTG